MRSPRRARQRHRAVARDDEVGAAHGRSTARERGLHAGRRSTATNDDEADADHERRGGDRRARRIARRVLAGELAGRVPEALQRPADERRRAAARRGARASRPRRTGARAGAHRRQPARRRTAAEQAVSQQRDADERRRARRRPAGAGRPAGGPRRPRASRRPERTRVARTAGMQRGGQRSRRCRPSSAMTIVRGASSSRAARDAHARQRRRGAPSSLENPRPASRPATDAATPRISASAATPAQHLAAGRAERAQQRELAAPLGDGDREGVEDDERADEQRGAREGQQRRLEERADAVVDLLRRVARWPAAPVLTSRLRGSAARRLRTIRSGVTPGAAEATMLVTLPSSRFHACTSAERRDDHRRAAHRGDVAEVDDADEARRVDAGAAGDADARADA